MNEPSEKAQSRREPASKQTTPAGRASFIKIKDDSARGAQLSGPVGSGLDKASLRRQKQNSPTQLQDELFKEKLRKMGTKEARPRKAEESLVQDFDEMSLNLKKNLNSSK